MTTKYEWVIKKDLPGLEKDKIAIKEYESVDGSSRYVFSGDNGSSVYVNEKYMEEHPEWFEKLEVKLKKWRSDVRKNEIYYFISNNRLILENIDLEDEYDDDRYSFGNYFKTKEQAEEAMKAISNLLMQLHEKWGE